VNIAELTDSRSSLGPYIRLYGNLPMEEASTDQAGDVVLRQLRWPENILQILASAIKWPRNAQVQHGCAIMILQRVACMFETVDNRIVIDFIKEIRFYSLL